MKIYYAHSRQEYGSLMEQLCIQYLLDHFKPTHPGRTTELINPRNHQGEIFNDLIESCGIFAFRKMFGKITCGVESEILYALTKHKQVFELNFTLGEFDSEGIVPYFSLTRLGHESEIEGMALDLDYTRLLYEELTLIRANHTLEPRTIAEYDPKKIFRPPEKVTYFIKINRKDPKTTLEMRASLTTSDLSEVMTYLARYTNFSLSFNVKTYKWELNEE